MSTQRTPNLKFRPADTGYQAGDERAYYVIRRGREIGIVERMEIPVGETEGNFVDGWGFTSTDNRHTGEGRSRAAAVADAIANARDC